MSKGASVKWNVLSRKRMQIFGLVCSVCVCQCAHVCVRALSFYHVCVCMREAVFQSLG